VNPILRARVLVVLALLPACAGLGQVRAGEYPIGPKDLIEIRVLEIPELNVERRVSDAGTIELPLIGELSVSNLTASEVRDRLENLLRTKYVNRATVTVAIREYANKPVAILGAVRTPGSLRISGRWTLIQALSAVGGLTEQAGRKIFVLRGEGVPDGQTIEISTEELFRGSSDRWNIPLFPGDVVNVPARTMVTIYCVGEFKQPGAVQLDGDDRLTLLATIAKAGGLTDRSSSTIRIRRRGADGKDADTVVNFKRILAGKDPDLALRPNDVIIVKESFF
jgi:polysaccharide export outer membrane protein